MQRNIYKVLLFFFICCITFLLLPEKIFSANFTVSPVRIFFDDQNKTNILTIKNNSDESVTVQLRAYTWTQNEKGENLYSPTKDIIFFPKIVTIKKEEEKIIRLGTRITRGEHEKTYRLYIEEIPSPEKLESTAVRIIMKVGAPIFITPLKTEPKGSIEKIALEKGILALSVKNSGNVHFIIRSIALRGSDASGKEILKTERAGGYLHSKNVKNFSFDIPSEDCLHIEKFEIAVDTDRTSMAGELNVLKEMCTP